MKPELEPLPTWQREIYDRPPGRDRFRHYLDVMAAGTDQLTCLYGDEIAEELGYRALGVPRYAGYRVAAEDAALSPLTPEAALA